MDGQATFDDWLEVVGLKPTIDAMLAGRLRLDDANVKVRGAREVYPNVSIDWLELIEELDQVISDMRDVVRRQAAYAEEILSLPEELGFAPPVMPASFKDYQRDRLLTAEETRALNSYLAHENDDFDPPQYEALDGLVASYESALAAVEEADAAVEEAAEALEEAIEEADGGGD